MFSLLIKKILTADIREEIFKYWKREFHCPICGNNDLVFRGDVCYPVTRDFYIFSKQFFNGYYGSFSCGNKHIISRTMLPQNLCFFNIPSYEDNCVDYFGEGPYNGRFFFYDTENWHIVTLARKFVNAGGLLLKKLLLNAGNDLFTLRRLKINDILVGKVGAWEERVKIDKCGFYVGFLDGSTIHIRAEVKSIIPQPRKKVR